MADTIKHQGIVENIDGSHLRVRIVQTSACAACSVRGHCSSADSKEKLIDVTDPFFASSCKPGDHVWVVGQLSMGWMAVLLAFIFPFFLVVISLFLFMGIWEDELRSALCALLLLIPYYYILWLNRVRVGKRFSFTIQPME